MGFDPASLPPKILQLMSEKDRQSLGKSGQTPAETNEKTTRRSEKVLQALLLNYLRLRGIEVIVSRMDRKTSNNVGTPDFLFAVTGHDGYQTRVFACAIEVKLPDKHLSHEQRNMRKAMTGPPNAWTHRVLHSIEELKMFLDGIGL